VASYEVPLVEPDIFGQVMEFVPPPGTVLDGVLVDVVEAAT
jgi:hypothetical protein